MSQDEHSLHPAAQNSIPRAVLVARCRPRAYRMVNLALPVATFAPRLHVTVAAGPGLLVLGFQVQDTAPPLPAVCATLREAPAGDHRVARQGRRPRSRVLSSYSPAAS